MKFGTQATHAGSVTMQARRYAAMALLANRQYTRLAGIAARQAQPYHADYVKAANAASYIYISLKEIGDRATAQIAYDTCKGCAQYGDPAATDARRIWAWGAHVFDWMREGCPLPCYY